MPVRKKIAPNDLSDCGVRRKGIQLNKFLHFLRTLSPLTPRHQ